MITKEEILNTALLAKLEIKDEDYDELAADLQGIIDFADTINSAPEICDDFDNSFSDGENRFREDTVMQSLSQEEILSNSKDTQNGFFLIKNRA